MSDIVARLRAPANWLRQDKGSDWKNVINHYDRTPFEAADEIERLKAELLERDAVWLPEKDAEIERLRAALAHADAKGQENDKLLWGTIKDNERLKAALRDTRAKTLEEAAELADKLLGKYDTMDTIPEALRALKEDGDE